MVEEIAIGQQFSQGSTNVGVKLFTSIFILGEEMATHFSILAWGILWTEEPGGLQSMRLQTVGHD